MSDTPTEKSPETAEERKARQREYNRKYYAANREKLNTRNKERYHVNPEIKARMRERAADRRLARNQKLVTERIARRKERHKPEAEPRKPKFATIGGNRVPVYSTGYLGRWLGYTTKWVRELLTRKVLPGASVRSAGGTGIAYFTKDYMEAADAGIASAMLLGSPTLDDMREHIARVFAERKVPVIPWQTKTKKT